MKYHHRHPAAINSANHDEQMASMSSAPERDSPESLDATSGQGPSRPRAPKTRTRTGCHTCRSRRVKCGEEKPSCQNCIKARRECSGYGQRIVFRDPLSAARDPMNGQSVTFVPPQLGVTGPSRDGPEGPTQRQSKAIHGRKAISREAENIYLSPTLVERHAVQKSEFLDDSGCSQPQMYHSHSLPQSILTTQKTPSHTRYLEDPHVSEIFRHFIYSTAAIFSLFELAPSDHVAIQGSRPTLRSRGLWTRIMPSLALSSPPLMHAMVAMSALHTAKTQDKPPVESLKHYGLAIRTLRKIMSSPSRNTDVAALGATLVLAYYELMASEHTKWTRHLHGARLLVDEIQFSEIVEQLRSTGKTTMTNSSTDQHDERGFDIPLFDAFMGVPLKQKLQESAERCRMRPLKADVHHHDTLADLFWFLRRQDMSQSIIGGGPLIFDYSHWVKCLPRTPMGYEEDTCGTSDHLVIIITRLAAFANRDQPRKAQVLQAIGGNWQPPKGLILNKESRLCKMVADVSEISSTTSGEVSIATSAERQPGNNKSYANMEDLASSYPRLIRADEIDTETLDAHSEWSAIRNALLLFESHLGPGYQPLRLDHSDGISSPFGPAVEFRGLGVAAVWNLYYAGLIMLQRVHPSMPPSPHQAAGICAIITAPIANKVGRITAGICSWSSRKADNLFLFQLQAALFESTIPMYYAGIQFQDSDQRQWLIRELLHIAKVTGFDSANAVAAGCETSWRVAASLGRGPPYERVLHEPAHKDNSSATEHSDTESSHDSDHRIAPDDNGMLGGRSIEDCKLVVWEKDGARAHWSLGVIEVEKQAEEMGICISRNI